MYPNTDNKSAGLNLSNSIIPTLTISGENSNAVMTPIKSNNSTMTMPMNNDKSTMTMPMNNDKSTMTMPMNNSNHAATAPCADSHGVLPACAPLAVPYVPFQQTGGKRYNHAEALNNGTLYPALNLPFHIKVKGSDMVSNALAELQAMGFVLQELALYLDTHPKDMEAFALFQQYVGMEKDARERYEKMYGPISRNATANGTEYTWFNNPWPWDYQEAK